MSGPRPQSVLLLLCAFVLAQLVHALHPLAHAAEAAVASGCCVEVSPSDLDGGDLGALADTDGETEDGEDCALCTASPPVAPLDFALSVSPEAAVHVGVVSSRSTKVRGPPAAFRSRAPPALI